MRMTVEEFSAADVLSLAASDVQRVRRATVKAIEEFEGGAGPGKDGRWAKRYRRRIGREMDALFRLVEQLRIAAGFGEMEANAVRKVMADAEEVMGLLRKAAMLAEDWEKRTPVEGIDAMSVGPEALPGMTEELRAMCLDNAALMDRLGKVRAGDDEMSVMLLDEIEEGQEDGLELAEALLVQAEAWRASGADEGSLVRFERGVGVFADGCRILMKQVEETRPFCAEALLELVGKGNAEALSGAEPVAH